MFCNLNAKCRSNTWPVSDTKSLTDKTSVSDTKSVSDTRIKDKFHSGGSSRDRKKQTHLEVHSAGAVMGETLDFLH